MNYFIKVIGLFFLILTVCCTPSKKINSNIICDPEIGICSPFENIENLIAPVKSKQVVLVSKPKLIYYYDALCGWCYGFNAVTTKLEEEYRNKFDVEVISGGLFLGNRAGRVNDVAPHIKAGAYKNVESKTGITFGDAFLKDLYGQGKIVLNSLPPSIALCIVKEKMPERQLEFAEMLLKAVYFDGLSSTNINGLAEYASIIGFDKEDFKTKMRDPKYKISAEKEFEKFKLSQFRGMPSLVLEEEGKQILLSNGYISFDKLKPILENHLQNIP